ncbi:hypothetical protein [uncultured Mediterranean phage uvMED]|nr:hypothetical protein [uncultured Mediterranean phage uvMED]
MSTTKNTSYKVHVHHTDQSEVDNVNIENGAMLHTADALYMGHNNQNVIVYPQGGVKSLGWARYQDTVYTSSSPLSLAADTLTILPNNAGTVTQSHSSIGFYQNGVNSKIYGQNLNDVYLITTEFKAQSPNANQTHLNLSVANGGGVIENLDISLAYVKGNAAPQVFHNIFQYYINQDFLDNGASLNIQSHGGTSTVWDIEYFTQRTQNGSLS